MKKLPIFAEHVYCSFLRKLQSKSHVILRKCVFLSFNFNVHNETLPSASLYFSIDFDFGILASQISLCKKMQLQQCTLYILSNIHRPFQILLKNWYIPFYPTWKNTPNYAFRVVSAQILWHKGKCVVYFLEWAVIACSNRWLCINFLEKRIWLSL